MTEFCRVEDCRRARDILPGRPGHVTVTITRPERLNALHPPANAELGRVFDDFAANDDAWVAIITGEGRGFCAGNDLRYQAEGGRACPRREDSAA